MLGGFLSLMKLVLSAAILGLMSLIHPCQAHVHISVEETESGLQIFVEDFFSGDFAPDVYPFRLPPAAMITFSQSMVENGIGRQGAAAWALPQAENPLLPFLGWSSRLPSARFQGNRVQFRFKSLSGPGALYVYQVGALGDIDVWINTADGIDEADAVEVRNGGGHLHCNWVFSHPGTYFLELQAEAKLSGTGESIASSSEKFRFVVLMPETKFQWSPDASGYRFQWQTYPGLTYQLESSPSLQNPDWTPVGKTLTSDIKGQYQSDLGVEFQNHQEYFRVKIDF